MEVEKTEPPAEEHPDDEVDDDRHSPPRSGTTTPSRAAKPALKKEPVLSPTEKKHLKWDEKAIEEHDLLRGTRMKIDEPNTPYTHYDSGGESDGSRPKSPANQRPTLQWDVLQNKLDAVSAVQEAYPNSPIAGEDGEHNSDVEDDRKQEMHKMEFTEHRKRHYNEMEAVRRFRQEHGGEVLLDNNNNGDDDEDGDADNEAD